jgi:fucose 4-O-acetylase-like acetyltransferase
MTERLTRKNWADYARGIGIVLVVFGHVEFGLMSAGIPMDKALFEIVHSVVYTFHMPLFFFLSGYFYLSSVRNMGACRFWQAKSC